MSQFLKSIYGIYRGPGAGGSKRWSVAWRGRRSRGEGPLASKRVAEGPNETLPARG